ncbi:ABC transporter substrate-binding protein [Facklamia sp. DSM 111018]|uniref:ABC transporter substrate-binding protein n=1 Tax=Facklamia lactis TaxID=2749967 RepID=A0ABS0LSV6_9LACT|nr:ABC transporter substrate-binding protein [Facklamia lactis]MBG9986344.1 ABC transporter substrate-binding protein [Facklamia lactis]
MRKLKNIKWMLFFMACISLLTGCLNQNKDANKSSTTTDGKTVLEFWSFWGAGPRREVVQELIDEYNSTQDKVEIKYVYQPWGDIWTKALSATAAGTPPDIIVQDINTVAQRAEAEQSVDLSQYIEEDLEKEFYPQLWDTVQYEEGIYGLPFNTDMQVIFYNKKLLEEANLQEADLPKTWEELEQIAHQLDVKEGESFKRIGFYPLWNIGSEVWSLNADNGISWFDENEAIKINTPKKVETFEWLKKWQKYYGKDTINNMEADFGDGMSDPFISEKIAMYANNINYYTSLKENAPEDFEFGIFPLPAKTASDKNWTWGGGFALEVPKGAKHVQESYDFIKFMVSQEAQEKYGANSYDVMANRLANESLLEGDMLSEEDKIIYQMVQDNFDQTVITPTPLSAPDYLNLVKEEIDRIMIDGKDPQEALKKAQESVENLVQQNE